MPVRHDGKTTTVMITFPGCTYTALAVGVRREYNDICVFPPYMLNLKIPQFGAENVKKLFTLNPYM